jgi:hypothetical protein
MRDPCASSDVNRRQPAGFEPGSAAANALVSNRFASGSASHLGPALQELARQRLQLGQRV